jgi:hypothetical protein
MRKAQDALAQPLACLPLITTTATTIAAAHARTQASINPRTQSPVVATVITGTIIGVLAFFVPLEILADLVSMGTLFAFTTVTLSVAVRARYATDKGIAKWRVAAPCALVVAGSCLIAFPYYYRAHYGIIVAGAAVFVIGTLAFYTLPVVYRPEGFTVPLNPILPCLGTLANIFLIGSLGPHTWIPWCYAMAAAVLLFALNGAFQYRTWWRKGGQETEFEDVDAITRLPSVASSTGRFGGSFQVHFCGRLCEQ